MKSAKPYAFRSAKPRSTCEDLHRLKVRIEAARRSAWNLYSAAMEATDSAALQNLEEDLKQTSAAHKFVCYAVEIHLSNQHMQTRDDRLAA